MGPRFALPRWRPAMTGGFYWVVVVVYALEATTRAADYLGGDRPGITRSLTVIEQAMPLAWWGAILLAVAAMVVAGVVSRRPKLVIVGAVVAGAAYMALAYGLTLKMLERGMPPDGYRTPVDFGAKALVWWAIGGSAWWSGHVERQRRTLNNDDRRTG